MKHLPLHSPDYRHLLRQFGQALQDQGYNRGQPSEMPSHVREFLHYLETRGHHQIERISSHHVYGYQQYLEERPNTRRSGGLSASHISNSLYALRLFFDYLMEQEGLEASPAHLPRFRPGQISPKEIPTVAEMKQLYAHTKDQRDRAILGLAYGGGLRRSEIERLSTRHLYLHRGLVEVIDGKGRKSASVALPDPVLADLRAYLIQQRPRLAQETAPSPAFLLNRFGQALSGQTCNERIKALAQAAGITEKPLTLHSLRHALATHLLDSGMPIAEVSRIMRHSQIDTTHLYSKRRRQHQARQRHLHP